MRIVVARVDDFRPGERRIVTHGRRSIGVFRVGDRFYAVNNHCPHLGGPLCEGRTQARVRSSRPGEYVRDDDRTLIACPWHGWEYDLATGQSFAGPGEAPARTYATAVEPGGEPGDGDVVRMGPGGRRPGPFVAETFEVTVERFGPDAHVVVDTAGRATRTGDPQ
ncbi:MAG: Rieske (2Fe-2S) protein [Actinomycetota bacterium]|nr:Rieske (2Fe-2S) protein [Actinomycetota bacterium]